MSDDHPEPPDVEAAKRLARQLGVGATPASSEEGEPAADEAEGRLQLDKDGTLVGRPKLQPVKALRDESAPEPDEPPADDDAPAGDGDEAPRRAALPPRRAALRPDGFIPPPPDEASSSEDPDAAVFDTGDEVEVEHGEFLFGDEATPRFVSSFHIDRFPVTNRQYARFVDETHHRPPLYWPDGVMPPALSDHPVVGVDYFDALAYAQWVGKDLPFEDEWERAARGTDGRTYPWGDETEFNAANTARVDLKMTTPVDLYRRNESPDGCRDMVGNVWELTHSPAAGGGVVVRGGSWYDFALYGKTYFRFATAPSARNGTIGFRCARRHQPRPDEPREVDGAIVDAEIASRRGSQPPVDAKEFSAERRDLVPDALRLNTYVHEVRAESLVGTIQPKPRKEPGPERDRPAEPESMLAAGATRLTDMPPAPEPSPASLDPLASAQDAPPSHAVEPDVGSGTPTPPQDDGPSIRLGAAGASAGIEPAAGGRVHVSGGRAPADAGGFEKAAADVAQSERIAAASAAQPKARSMPWSMWLLLAAGFALFGALLVSLLTADKTNDQPAPVRTADGPADDGADDGTNTVPAPDTVWSRIPPFPEYGKGLFDGRVPRVIDAADAAQRAELDNGTWALFFLDPGATPGSGSLPAIHRLHRRTVERGLRVAVVLDRADYVVDGTLMEASALLDRLREHKFIADGMTAVLDPSGEDGEGVLKGRFARAGKALYASLVHQGATESRTRPPRSAPFEMRHLVPLVERAIELVPDLLR